MHWHGEGTFLFRLKIYIGANSLSQSIQHIFLPDKGNFLDVGSSWLTSPTNVEERTMQQQLFHLKGKRNVLYPPIMKKNVQAIIKNQEDKLPGLYI